MVEYQCYMEECKELHYHLLNDSVITLDMIPQYVRIVERHYIYIMGLKQTMFTSKGNTSLIRNFFLMMNDDILSLPRYTFDVSPLEVHNQMIYILSNTLSRLEYDYGKDIRQDIESSLESSVLRTLRTYEDYGKQSVINSVQESLNAKRT